MTEPRDQLLDRYADAVAQDPRRPADRVRNAARAHAQMLRDQAAAVQRVEVSASTQPAANQSQWTISLVASLAVVGLAGLIFVQIDRGTPDVREAGLGTAARNEAPYAPSAATPTPSAKTDTDKAPSMPQLDATSPVANSTIATAPAPTKKAAAVAAHKELNRDPTTGTIRAPLQAAAQTMGNAAAARTDAATQPAEAEMVSKSDNKLADQYAGAAAPREARTQGIAESVARAAPVARPATPAPAAPAAIAPPAPAIAAAPAPPPGTPQRARQMEAVTPTALYLEAARTGNTETLQKLLTQGVAINARDDTGNTALMVAVRHRQASVVRTLLDAGADTRLTNHDGMTALQIADQLGLANMAQLLQPPR